MSRARRSNHLIVLAGSLAAGKGVGVAREGEIRCMDLRGENESNGKGKAGKKGGKPERTTRYEVGKLDEKRNKWKERKVRERESKRR